MYSALHVSCLACIDLKVKRLAVKVMQFLLALVCISLGLFRTLHLSLNEFLVDLNAKFV